MTTLSGNLEVLGDEDWIGTTLTGGISYVISFQPNQSSPDRPVLANVFTLADRRGVELATTGFDQDTFEIVTQALLTPQVTSEFFASISGFQGGYNIVIDTYQDDLPDNPSTNGQLAPGGNISGVFELAGDEDWVKADLDAGKTYVFEISYNNANNPFAAGGIVEIFGEGDSEFDRDFGRSESTTSSFDISGSIERAVFTPRVDTEYFVQLQSLSAGGWTVSLREQQDDYADHSGTTGTVSVGGSTSGNIEVNGDEDWFRVELSGGVTYRLEATGTGGSPKLLEAITVDDSPFGLTASDYIGFGGGTVFTPLEDSTYFVQVSGQAGAYNLSVVEQQDDFADNVDTTGRLTEQSNATGRINAAFDKDWFSASLQAGVTYKVVATPNNQNQNLDLAAFGVNASQIGPESNVVRPEFADVSDNEIVFTPRSAGEYFFEVSGAVAGNYGLSLARQQDDFADNQDTTGVIAAGQTRQGTWETADDSDWVRAELSGGTTYRFSAAVDLDQPGTFLPTALTVEDDVFGGALDADVGFITRFEFGLPTTFSANNDSLNEAVLVFTPRLDSTYYINMQGAQGTWELAMDIVQDDFPDHSSATGGGPINGTPGPDNLTGTAAGDTINAAAGNDRLEGAGGNDFLNGAGGVDRAAGLGASGNYILELDGASNTIRLSDKRPDGTGSDLMQSVELVQFSDGFSFGGNDTFDLREISGAVGLSEDMLLTFVEMYVAYFDRAPDALGLFYWGTRLADGMGLGQIAQSFFFQDETFALYPELEGRNGIDDPSSLSLQFYQNLVRDTYNKLLERAPDDAGRDFWIDELQSGSVRLGEFVLAVINGAKDFNPTGATPEQIAQAAIDAEVVQEKGQLGYAFAVDGGMNNVNNAANVMGTYDINDREGSIAAGEALVAQYRSEAEAPGSTEFIVQIASLGDDPLAIA